MASDGETWLSNELKKLELDDGINSYILSMEDVNDRRDYIVQLIDTEKNKNIFLQGWKSYFERDSTNQGFSVYQKKKFNVENSKKPREKNKIALNNSLAINEKNGLLPDEHISNNNEIGIGAKKKAKFVSLYSKEGQAKSVIQLPGRHICECQATKHKLINNCIQCGRIVCEQEGAGPCIFCGSLVCTPDDQDVINKGSKKGEKLRQWLMKGGNQLKHNESSQANSATTKQQEGFVKALEHRNKLLEFDKNSVRRTQVIDDECDYFATDANQWLSEEEKNKLRNREEMLRQERHGSRRDRKITFDFAGRRVIDAADNMGQKMYDIQDSVIQEVYFGSKTKNSQQNISNPSIEICNPQFDDSAVDWGPSKQQETTSSNKSKNHRIQDRELQEMSDHGYCLSMHQPWASLLVAGIKKDEGRTWYSPHRGRLWIASTAKAPSSAEIKELESSYSHLYQSHPLQFPKSYPTGSLLGCVIVKDCLSQEEYREQYPDGESNSPFVFICCDPQELVIKFPIKGKHKIYKLDQNIHQAAKKGLR